MDGKVRGVTDMQEIAAQRLLLSVAEQLKVPLTTIARQAELSGQLGESSGQAIAAQASIALKLVDCYMLGLELAESQMALLLEPVSVSSLLVETAYELRDIARQYDVMMDVQVAGKYAPVMAHRQGLKAALLSLGYALIEAAPSDAPRTVTLAIHRTPQGIITGAYGNHELIGSEAWRKARTLVGKARQPFTALSHGSGAGLYVADTLMRAMAANLRVGKYRHQYGMAATLQVSQQLSLV